MSQRKSQTTAVIALSQLKSCLVNLPSALVNVLDSSNTAAQNVIVELQFKTPQSAKKSSGSDQPQQSIFVGWTGMVSQRRAPTAPTSNGRPGSRDREAGQIEIDSSFARTLGLSEGQKVGVVLHADPQSAHTVNIEPLTPEDWEIIELHATFLETNLIQQVRALPNPTYTGSVASQAGKSHPLTIHLSPTSTANVNISSLAPALPANVPFAKLDPEAEVIVAPKTRTRQSVLDKRAGRSVTSMSQRSVGGRSGTSQRGNRSDGVKRPVFLRGLALRESLKDESSGISETSNGPLRIWVDPEVLSSKSLRGNDHACVSIVQPGGTQSSVDPQQIQRLRDQEGSEAGKHATKVVAKLSPWDDALDTEHSLLSSSLCAALGTSNMVGGVVRLEAAPPMASTSEVQSLRIYPILSQGTRQKDAIKFGGETRAARDAAAERLRLLFGSKEGTGLLGGALTDGMILPSSTESRHTGWYGGMVRFFPLSNSEKKSELRWMSDIEGRYVEVQTDIADPFELQRNPSLEEDRIPEEMPTLVGIDPLMTQLMSHLTHQSSVLLAGGLGSGKTSLAYLLAHRLRNEHFFYTSYLNCRKLVADETRVTTVKDSLERLFLKASWGCKLGGKSLVILDDLDKLCPADTELQVGGEARNRQISELLVSMVKQFCSPEAGTVLLATSKSKDDLHAVVVGGHVFRETVEIKAPDKDKRRRILESLTGSADENDKPSTKPKPFSTHSRSNSRSSSGGDAGWLDSSASNSRPGSSGLDGLAVSKEIDFLEVAGQTDGYMPEDLTLLCSRARSEALIRSVSDSSASIELLKEDFDNALAGFTPASLRNVTLQSSSTTFDSIGGLHETRKVLIETLQYPTTYAPIFAQCPLRLRSGLLLYGFPGCGKTLLASAVAGECGLNFISVKGPEILNKYIGASEKSVRDLFERAQAARPCVLFFDEFDSIAPKRGHDSTGVTDRVVNQLLTQMDGAEGLSGVYVLAATSRPDLIDPALLRPGRLDKSLLCDMPLVDDRLDILLALSKTLQMNPAILADSTHSSRSLKEIARRTEGYSGADLQAVVYNAHLEAIHDVLGDHKTTSNEVNGTKPTKKVSGSGSAQQDFIQFRYGEEEDKQVAAEKAASGFNRAQQLAERASLVAKVEALTLAKRKEKALKRSGVETNTLRARFNEEKQPEAVIEWKHLEASLESTRSSISPVERRKLDTIYREFVVGRNGEMPSGQGPMEIGARSSLM